MLLNVDIDDDLMAKAQTLNASKTQNEIIEEALTLLITIGSQKGLIDLWGN